MATNNHVIPITLSDIQRMVFESVRKITISCYQLNENKPKGYWNYDTCYQEAYGLLV